MYKGTNASAGIGIGKVVVVEEQELVIKREMVTDPQAEIQRFKGALETSMKQTQDLAADLATPCRGKRSRDPERPCDALIRSYADRGDRVDDHERSGERGICDRDHLHQICRYVRLYGG